MRYFLLFFTLLMCLALGTAAVTAQNDICNDGNASILEQVSTVCSTVGANEACYGNRDVSVSTSNNADVLFDEPGALINISNIRSIFLSEVNEAEGTWGVAQLRLLVNQGNGVQDVTMLLFGDVTLDNQVEEVRGEAATITSEAQVFPIAPSQGFDPTTTLAVDTPVEVIGRLADSPVWVQIIVPETGDNGWVFKSRLDLSDSTFASLPIEDGTKPLFGSMQAFTLQSGTSACDNTVADGLIIQTPEGMARVSFLINEVTIELTGAGEGASAFVQANPDEGAMDINVLDGTAYVSAGPNTEQVNAGSQTSIPVSTEMRPVGAPSRPQAFNADEINTIPVLPVVRDPDRPYVPPANPQVSRSQAIASSDSSLVVPDSSSGSGGVNVTTSDNTSNTTNQTSNQTGSNGTGNGGSSSNGSANTASNNTTNSTGSGSASGGDGPNVDNNNNSSGLPGGGALTGSGNRNSQNNDDTESNNLDEEEEPDPLGTWIRWSLFGSLVVLGIGFLVWIVYLTRRGH